MIRPRHKIAVALSALALAVVLTGCGSGLNDLNEDDFNGQLSPQQRQVIDTLGDKTYAGDVLPVAQLPAYGMSEMVAESQKMIGQMDADPADCAEIFYDPMLTMDPEKDPPNVVLFMPQGQSDIDSVMYNLAPSTKVVERMDEVITLAQRCPKASATMQDEDVSAHFSAHALDGYDDVATKATQSHLVIDEYSESDDEDDTWVIQLLLNDGAYLYVSATNKDTVSRATDDALKHLGLR